MEHTRTLSAHSPQEESDLALGEQALRADPPPLFNVLLLNDDYTPMDFVIAVLEQFFGMNRESATRVMLEVHTQGQGLCGAFSRDVAETKVMQVNQSARQNGHPLLSVMERA
ncbi:MAG: ATP-dependent Clp protease adapter ClpS [Halothiobacillaceae bacterium]|jgi:ATP-dependent Clp protease adaptor protein ClpS|nr:ATP-dependent Clp protease adapter ClpS [Halothiobacillaceae bacterium]MDY0049770.1 ATP-dependent Clp protease adapter ClpS [Halothiobacillaceae bacterium]